MAFVNERFPVDISFDAKETVRHSTNVIRVNSGRTSRNQNWALPLREFDVSHAARIQSYMQQLVAFNLTVAQGMANTFRYKAWGDFKVATGEGVFIAIDATHFQMAKRYTFGAALTDRPIVLPVASTIVITGSGSYSFVDTTGIVTTVTGTAPTGWSGEFDIAAYMGVDLAEVVIRDKSGSAFVMGADQILLMEDR